MPDLVEARWKPMYPVQRADGTILEPGDTMDIPKDEAQDSDHWEPVKRSAPKKGDS